MIVINDIEQGTKEWLDLRRCKVSGTRLDSVMGSPLDRVDLISELIAEEFTEQSKVLRPTPEMERGSAEEPFAIKMFEEKTGKKVTNVGICISEEFDWLVESPDGLIKDKKGKYTEAVEVKSPDSKTAVKYRIANTVSREELGTKAKPSFLGVPDIYKWQVVQKFIVNSDLNKLYFLVYDARFIDDEHKLYIVEIERSHPSMLEAIEQAKTELVRFRENWMAWKELVLPSNF